MLFTVRSIVPFSSSIAASPCVCGPVTSVPRADKRAEPVVTPACGAGAVGAGRRRCKLRRGHASIRSSWFSAWGFLLPWWARPLLSLRLCKKSPLDCLQTAIFYVAVETIYRGALDIMKAVTW